MKKFNLVKFLAVAFILLSTAVVFHACSSASSTVSSIVDSATSATIPTTSISVDSAI